MNRTIQADARSGREVYPDIIDLPHHQSKKHPHMSLYDRAAQFSPFAALIGYDDMIAEESRETGTQKDQEIDRLNAKLDLISSSIASGNHPALTFTVFVPDEKKAGGEYVQISGTVKKVDMLERTIILYPENNQKHDGTRIELKNLSDIHGKIIDPLDDGIL